jgi:hypothetical protein
MSYAIVFYIILFTLYSIYFEFSIQDEILRNTNIGEQDRILLRNLLAYDGKVRFRICFGACNKKVWSINDRVRKLLMVRTAMLFVLWTTIGLFLFF